MLRVSLGGANMDISSKEELLSFLTDLEGRVSNTEENLDNLQPVDDEEETTDDEETTNDEETSDDDEEVSDEELDEIEEMFND